MSGFECWKELCLSGSAVHVQLWLHVHVHHAVEHIVKQFRIQSPQFPR